MARDRHRRAAIVALVVALIVGSREIKPADCPNLLTAVRGRMPALEALPGDAEDAGATGRSSSSEASSGQI